MDKTAIKNMNTEEKLQTMEAIWDSLCYSDSEPESPDWHGDILEGRKMRIKEGKGTYMSLQDLKKMKKG